MGVDLSAADLFNAANEGSTDLIVTVGEVAKLMSTFDANRSGTLDPAERQLLMDRYPFVSR